VTRRDSDADVALWLIAQFTRRSQVGIRRRLSRHVAPARSEVDARKEELGELATMLRRESAKPGWSFRYVHRSVYEAERPARAPSSAALVSRYGSWANTCRHADSVAGGTSNKRAKHRRNSPSNAVNKYSEADIILAVRECANELQRAPSSHAYHAWRLAAERRRRSIVYPSTHAIRRQYRSRGGWIAALEAAGLREPPTHCVRVLTPSRRDAARAAEGP
jgi:hypothetical protein